MRISLSPQGSMSLLSQVEIDRLQQSTNSALYKLFRNCVLAVLNVGSHTDNADDIFNQHNEFEVNVLRRERGVKLELINPPPSAFVDGELIVGIREHVESVLRDILFVGERYPESMLQNCDSRHLTHIVFDILRNANTLKPIHEPDMVVCWGGHSINEAEYKYSKVVGYELGLRGFNICTGCGPGAMKGPMKGATIGHAKQRMKDARYLGLTEPGIIAAEPPNPIVNELVIMPDIEKRLEAFVRCAHSIIVFPGGAGTAEEVLYLLGIMMHPNNKNQALSIVLTGPESSKDYFVMLDQFIRETLGEEATQWYTIIIEDPEAVAQHLQASMAAVKRYRRESGDAYYFNWTLHIEEQFQHPFEPTHENVAKLDLHRDRPKDQLAADLRRAFSAIVAGNVKAPGIAEIRKNGPYEINGEPSLMKSLDTLLKAFVEQDRMKLPGGTAYEPCYRVVTKD
ncbi:MULTISPECIES: nucleotide 5'-monophosphate nucleosidase PpnN [Gammaproteobacteria]|uniref:nucleotide 5'-monophosphate nucleosidase PpnN n=1 Tax=Gammaproteobacteria TaxID=1236 RepID=UPI000DCF981E|nr:MULTISPECIES: nucleotide 5'-monophosphate nucleosidase PpnN [Gammaproteobacteria]RTE86980.1 LOG family protein [Aliidiomarina sp. B3213]TCZ93230.1 LOG family protein [Lysobacter sp. N42]